VGGGGSVWVSKRAAMTGFQFFLCRILLHLILAWSQSMKLNISRDIWVLSDFGHHACNRFNSKSDKNYFLRFCALKSPLNLLKLKTGNKRLKIGHRYPKF
jgi:hypothetical protein